MTEQLAEGFLSKITDEQHRAIIAPYIKEWDAGVNKRFREINEEVKPYKDLGTVDEIKSGLELIASINDDPLAFYSNLYDFLVAEELIEVIKEPEEEVEETEVPVGISKEWADKFNSMEKELSEFKETFTTKTQAQENDAQQQRFDSYVKEMHTLHGDFDDDYFTAKVAKGIKPEEAIASFKKLTEGKNGTPKPPAKVFTGSSGSFPQEQPKMTFKDEKERKKYVLETLLAANAEE